jgi:beta-mannosidase
MPHGRLRAISGHTSEPLASGWEFTSSEPNAISDPSGLALGGGVWTPADVPCTVASALRAQGLWSVDEQPRRFDADDWWFRTTFRSDAHDPAVHTWLCLDGLATVADVWLNGTRLLESRGMFTPHECRLDAVLRPENVLVIRFRSLDALLSAKRPRPRWRTPMVDHQQLRWFRTTLLGRTPGWSPPAAAVGPWRAVRIERRSGLEVSQVRLQAAASGEVSASVQVTPLGDGNVDAVDLVLRRAEVVHRLPMQSDGQKFATHSVLPNVALWWPHTHGEPALYDATFEIRRGASVSHAHVGAIGFRTVSLATDGGDFRLHVNGEPVFCRGGCWTPLDVVSLDATGRELDDAFTQMIESGMNMVRVGGTMVYESDAFLDRCDAHGVLLWQDFMFANMDYPSGDAAFSDEVTAEVTLLLDRLQGRPSLAVLCGNSEGEQQPAMWGAPREQWKQALFHEAVPALVREQCPQACYWPSSTHGGDFPHQGNAGTASYYGVGAYLLPLEDARRAEVRFATECLAFANVPDESNLERLPSPRRLRVHHAVWKARSPRDLGAGWDFDDVRDHYMQRLFGVDPLAVRYADHDRYLDLGRVVTGEVMSAAFLEWRRSRSLTRGALVWFLRDLWPGAGWGVIDSEGRPKAAWYYLRRAMSPLALGLSDEGGNGIAVHIINDRPAAFRGTIEVALFRAGEVRVGEGTAPVQVAPRTAVELNALALFGDFQDLSYAYRFGPPPHQIVAATLRTEGGMAEARAIHFIGGCPVGREKDVGLAASAQVPPAGLPRLLVSTRRFAQSVHIHVPGYRPDDDYFHVLPGDERTITLRPNNAGAPAPRLSGTLRALNAEVTTNVALP